MAEQQSRAGGARAGGDGTVNVEDILRAQLAEHGDGARALDVAERATGLPRRAIEVVLWRLLSGRNGEPVAKVAPPATGPDRPRPRSVTPPNRCPVCGRTMRQLKRHQRYRHPEAQL